MLAAHEATKNALSCSGIRPAYVTTHFMFGGVIVCVADGGRGFNLAGRHRDAFPGPEQPAEQPGRLPEGRQPPRETAAAGKPPAHRPCRRSLPTLNPHRLHAPEAIATHAPRLALPFPGRLPVDVDRDHDALRIKHGAGVLPVEQWIG